jgi:hypothetical protein
MPVATRITTRQSIFLRSLLNSAPDPTAWPSPTILRRWLRRPAFLRALDTLRLALNYASDLLVAYAASSAALALHQPQDPDAKTDHQKSKLDLIRLSHLRQRFPAITPAPTARPHRDPTELIVHQRVIDLLRIIHPNANAREALEFFQKRIDAPAAPPPSRDAILRELDQLEHPVS